jgi:hypothetical protein
MQRQTSDGNFAASICDSTASGAGRSDVEENGFGDRRHCLAPILAQFLADSRPVLTGIGVVSFAFPETLVEIEPTAALK